jgi:hypothetical protein
MHISINFANYVDNDMLGARAEVDPNSYRDDAVSEKVKLWLNENVSQRLNNHYYANLKFLGTGALTDDMIVYKDKQTPYKI